jgi:citrate lyase subunit beta/citryl-CoA lyase
MPPATRPRRSLLYMPASNPRALEKAKTIPSDVLIFDIEDAVAPDAKPAARTAAVAAAGSKDYGKRELLIRVNGLDTAWCRDDVTSAATSGAAAIVLPKVNRADDVKTVADWLATAGAPPSMGIWAMMETPLGILNVREVAQSSPRLIGFCVGTADLAKDLHCAHPADRWPMLSAMQTCILTARAYDLLIVDGVHVDLADEKGLEAACRQGRALGFDGKTLIHPKQVPVANAIFGPGADEVEHARRMVAAFKEGRAKGKGLVVLDGKMVEALHVAEAERLLAQAEMIAEADGA